MPSRLLPSYFSLVWLVILFCVPLLNFSQSLQSDSVRLLNSIREVEGKIWGNYPKELVYAKQLYESAQQSTCVQCRYRSDFMMGKYYWADGYYKDGLKYYNRAMKAAIKNGDSETEADCLYYIATTYYYQAYYDSALRYYDQAYKIYEFENDPNGMIKITHNTSLLFHRKGDFKKTIEYILKKEHLEEQYPEVSREVEAFGAMGTLLIDTIYYKQEIIDGLSDIKKYRLKSDSAELVKTYFTLGKSFDQLGKYIQAANYYRIMCLRMNEQDIRPDWQFVATMYKLAHQKDSSFYYIRKAQRENYRGTRLHNSWVMELAGEIHLYFKQPDSAIYYYENALRINKLCNNRITIAGVERGLADAYTMAGNFEQAEAHLLYGLSVAREAALIHERNLYKSGKNLYEQAGNYKQALDYQVKFSALSDSINNQETAINLTILQAEFKTAKKEREAEEWHNRNTLSEAKVQTRNFQIILAVASALVIGLGGIFYYSQYQRKNRMAQILTRQNREKELLLAEIHHRVKNNLQIMNSLINIKTRTTDKETGKVLHEIVSRIHALGLIYEMLYKSADLNSIDLKAYLTEQAQLTFSTLENMAGQVKANLQLDPITVDVETAMNIGLIHNELLTNIAKYAYLPDQANKEIYITLAQSNDSITFSVSDNGLRMGLNGKTINKSFGLRFVEQIVTSKLRGTMEIKYEEGFKVSITLNPKKLA